MNGIRKWTRTAAAKCEPNEDAAGVEYSVYRHASQAECKKAFKFSIRKKKKKSSVYFMRGPSREPLHCFETNHGPRGFQLLIARCHANQEGHLSRWRTSEKLAGQRGSPLNVLSMPPDVNRVDLRNAVDTATLCSLSTQPRLTPGAGSLFACHVVPSPSRSGTKWNFHFLVCE